MSFSNKRSQHGNSRFRQVRELSHTLLFDIDKQLRRVAGATAIRHELVKTVMTHLASLHAEAGDDQLLMPSNLADAENAVLAAVASGRLTEARIDESVTRLLRLIENGRVDPTPLTTHRFPFAQVERAFHMMETKEDNVIKPLITY